MRSCIIIFLASVLSIITANAQVPDWVVYPEEKWQTITPEEAGVDVNRWNAWIASLAPNGSDSYGQNPGDWGTVLVRGGYLLHSWGNPDFKFQNSSVGKAFTRMVLQLALDEGLIKSLGDLVRDTWTGEGQLSHEHKYLTVGHNQKLTWDHLAQHKGGFPVTNGYNWKNKTDVPSWANWTGDPNYDNYSHIEPGTQYNYASGGYWRLSQALTALWDKDLKQVLDEKLFSKMGIPADRWDWLPGQTIHDDFNFYPTMPGYGQFVDPPYEINGHRVLGGGGWVVMSASDLARVALLIATNGIWKGEQIIGKSPYFNATSYNQYGGNSSELWGSKENEYVIGWGRLLTGSITKPSLDMFIGPVKVHSRVREEIALANVPDEFDLSQNFPNPFNPETTIQYNIAKQGNVNLAIFDVQGRTVRTLVTEHNKPGIYSVKWDGRDNYGNVVSSGIYFYQLNAENLNIMKKMIFMR